MPDAALESVALASASDVVEDGPVDVASDPDEDLVPLLLDALLPALEALLLADVPVDVAAEPDSDVPPTRASMKVSHVAQG